MCAAGGLLGPQMSMQTTLDLVLLLLDDIDAGRDVDALRTEQLRNAIFSSEGALLSYPVTHLHSLQAMTVAWAH